MPKTWTKKNPRNHKDQRRPFNIFTGTQNKPGTKLAETKGFEPLIQVLARMLP